jgi:chaperonin GroEL (HSP60 family)
MKNLSLAPLTKQSHTTYEQPNSSTNQIRNTLQHNILSSCALADLLKTSLGPNGLSKLIVDEHGQTIISADGATILNSLKVFDPAASLLVQAAQAQEFAFGDGTSSVPILSAQLLREAQKLICKGIPATRIAFGYQSALQHVDQILNQQVVKEITDLTDPVQLREGITIALSSKQTQQNEFIIDLLTRAISKSFSAKKSVKETKRRNIFSLENVIAKKKFQTEMKFYEESNIPAQFKANDLNIILAPGKHLTASEIVNGIIFPRVSRTTRKEINECRIALISLIEDAVKLSASTMHRSKQTILLQTPQQLRNWKIDENNLIKQQIALIRDTGANVVVTMGKLTDSMLHWLDSFEMLAFDSMPHPQFRHLAEACGGTICHHVTELTREDLGRAARIQLLDITGNQCTLFSGLPFDSKVTILLHATSIQLCEEVRRSLEDGVFTVKALAQNGKIIPGAGAAELNVGLSLREIADNTDGVDQFIWRAFGEACFVIPMTLAENAGANPHTTLAALIEKYRQGHRTFGVGADRGVLIDTKTTHVYDLLTTKQSVFSLATNCAATILRVAEVVQIT